MRRLYRQWDASDRRFGDVIVILFLLMQCLDGVFTYLGVKTWGLDIEANPIVSGAVSAAGLGVGLAGAKLFAVALGIALHLRRIHTVVAVLAAIYFAFAIVPWAAVFLIAR